MNEIIKQLENGEFEYSNRGAETIKLKSGINLWADNGWTFYKFYPALNTKLTLSEKWRIRKALKKGLIKKALSNPE